MGNAESSLEHGSGSDSPQRGPISPEGGSETRHHGGEELNSDNQTKSSDSSYNALDTDDGSRSNAKSSIATVDSSKSKELAIVRCLDNGKGNNEVVDLWELRNLSISKHGLVGYSLRRRAWPKLLSVHDFIDTGATTSNTNVLSASPEDMAYVRKLCQHGTVWNIIDYWREKGEPVEQQDCQESELDQDMSQQLSFVESTSPRLLPERRVSFDLGATTPTKDIQSGVGADTPASFMSFETAEEVENSDNCDTFFSPNKKGTSPLDVAGSIIGAAVNLFSPINTSSRDASQDSSRNRQPPSSPQQRRSSLRTSPTAKRQKQERQTLSNIIIHVLRSAPPVENSYPVKNGESTSSDSKGTPDTKDAPIRRYHPYSGIQNIAAMLLMQLKSPSLASLALSQLASYQLNEYFCNSANNGSGTREDEDSNSSSATVASVDDDYCYMTLLEHVDPQLYRHIGRATDNRNCDGIKQTPSFIRDSWRPTWFTNDIPDIEVVARLWDLLIVSHPLCSA